MPFMFPLRARVPSNSAARCDPTLVARRSVDESVELPRDPKFAALTQYVLAPKKRECVFFFS